MNYFKLTLLTILVGALFIPVADVSALTGTHTGRAGSPFEARIQFYSEFLYPLIIDESDPAYEVRPNGLQSPLVRVTYRAEVENLTTGTILSNGDTVEVGDQLEFRKLPHQGTDVYYQPATSVIHVVWYPEDGNSGFGGGDAGGLPSDTQTTPSYYEGPHIVQIPDKTIYGHWVDDAALPPASAARIGQSSCLAQDFYHSRVRLWPFNTGMCIPSVGCSNASVVNAQPFDDFVPFSIAPPDDITVTHSGTATLSCNASGTLCEVTEPGSVTSTISVPATIAKWYHMYEAYPSVISLFGPQQCFLAQLQPFESSGLYDDPVTRNLTGPQYVYNVPAVSIPISYTVNEAANTAPNPPLISGPTETLAGDTESFSFQASDPDGDTIRYAVDWNNDGTVDQYLPASGYVASGSSRNSTRSWGVAGVYTFRAYTEDNLGLRSAWASHTITVTDPIPDPPTVILTANPTTVSQGGSSTLTWSSTNADTCTGIGFSTGGATNGTVSVTNLTNTTTYTITCSGGGGSDADSATVTVSTPAPTVSLDASPSAINEGSSSTLSWTSTNATTCSGSGFSTGGATSGTRSVSPTSNTTYSVTCTGAGGSDTDSATVTIIPASLPTASLTASPSQVAPGESSTLSWTSTNATTCSGSGFSTGAATSGSLVVNNITSTTNYSVTCSGTGGDATDGATVTVVAPEPTATLTANPTQINTGGSSTLSWTSTNATTCSGSGFSTGGATSGTRSVSPTSNTTYSVTCTGAGGSDTDSASVTVVAPSVPTASLNANPQSVNEGGSSTLTWSSGNATSCTGTGFSTGGATGGSVIVNNITTDTTYTVTCSGSGGSANDSVAVSVLAGAPAVSLTASPSTIDQGDSSTLTWSSTNSSSCSGTGFSTGGATSGTRSVSPASSTTYSVTCSGTGGDATDSALVTVNNPSPSPAPTAFLSANPTEVTSGGSSTLSWTSTNADSCSGNGFSTGGATSGSVVVSNITSNTTYTLTCSGAGGNTQDDATVSVLAGDPTVTLSASPTQVVEGGSVLLGWTSTNTTSCASSDFQTGGATSGTQSVGGIVTERTFTITCIGQNGSDVEDDVTVTILPPDAPTVILSASPAVIAPGNSSTLSWTSTNADSCSGNGFSTGGATSGSVVVSPTSDTTYTISCTGAGGTTQDTAQVFVQAGLPVNPSVSIETDPADKRLAKKNEPVDVVWSAEDVDSCELFGPEIARTYSDNGSPQSISGSERVTIRSESTFTIVCQSADGELTDSFTIKIVPGFIET